MIHSVLRLPWMWHFRPIPHTKLSVELTCPSLQTEIASLSGWYALQEQALRVRDHFVHPRIDVEITNVKFLFYFQKEYV